MGRHKNTLTDAQKLKAADALRGATAELRATFKTKQSVALWLGQQIGHEVTESQAALIITNTGVELPGLRKVTRQAKGDTGDLGTRLAKAEQHCVILTVRANAAHDWLKELQNRVETLEKVTAIARAEDDHLPWAEAGNGKITTG